MENIFDILLVPMGYLLRFAYQLTHSYMLAIFLFTIVMELILSPFAIKQQKNQIKQASLAPKVAAIRKKYAGRTDQATQQKMNQETMDLYQRENFNPASGCGTLIIQLPIIMALYNVVTQPLRYICNVASADIKALTTHLTELGHTISAGTNAQIDIINIVRDNPGNYTAIAPSLTSETVIPNFTTLGLDLSQTPTVDSWLVLIPIITFIVMVATQKIMQKFTYQDPMQQNQQNSASMKIMTWTMPLMSVFFEFSMAAAIGVYWIFRSLISTVQRIIITKLYPLPKFTEEDYKAAEKAMNSNKKAKTLRDPSKPRPRSLHHIDDEEYLAKIAKEDEEYARLQEEAAAAAEETTDAKDAPAAIKNDEKTVYKKKK